MENFYEKIQETIKNKSNKIKLLNEKILIGINKKNKKRGRPPSNKNYKSYENLIIKKRKTQKNKKNFLNLNNIKFFCNFESLFSSNCFKMGFYHKNKNTIMF